jgi:DNA-binding beta-propeller fold protein YncE
VLLPTGWTVQPAGNQVPVGSFPLASVASRKGGHLAVLNCGERPSLSVVDVAAGKEIAATPLPDAWLGLAREPKGDRVYVGGGAEAAVFELTFAEGRLHAGRTFPIVEPQKRTADDFVGDVALSPDGRLIYAAELFRNTIAVVNPQSGMVIGRFQTGPTGSCFILTARPCSSPVGPTAPCFAMRPPRAS